MLHSTVRLEFDFSNLEFLAHKYYKPPRVAEGDD